MELSKRLQAVADFVTTGYRVADIGTDHGYIPIWLVENGKIPSAVAMDINRGPLEKARDHVAAHGLEGYITTRLSDGMEKLEKEEAQSVVIAGMGGALVIRILEVVKEKELGIQEWILQPQSELRKVRTYLQESGYQVVAENMVLDDGKYYPMMKVVKGKEECSTEAELCYGKLLLRTKHPVLKEFLQRELRMKTDILERLCVESGESAAKRAGELKEEIAVIQEALKSYAL